MKLGSLFDGSGGFPLACALCGIEPVWASEVEPYPIAVTKSRSPNMKHLGDVSKINGAEIEPVDIITFGSPCQDMSVAGKRAGLKHEANGDEETTRSGLFMEAVRIIKEMREATNGEYPRFAVWENVPGAFSSNKGEDFRIVLEELIKVAEPYAVMPEVPKKGWAYADCFSGDGWSLAYRVFDAQYWGVPQRRRRSYLVADFRGQCAQQILFEREGVRGHFTQSGTPWQGTPADVERSVGADDREGESKPHVVCAGGFKELNSAKARSDGFGVEIAPTLSANKHDASVAIGIDGYNAALTGDKSATIGVNCGMSTGRNGVIEGIVLDDQGGQQITVRADGKAPTLRAETHGNLPCVMEPKTYDARGNVQADNTGLHEVPGALNCMHDQQAVMVGVPPRYIVRRLTPTECARLQGFPDEWGHIDHKDDFTDEEYEFWLNVRNTHAGIYGKEVKNYTKKQMLTWYNKLHTDSAEYKMWGNGIALPCALYVMQGIAETEARNV
jgi:DNA (cytosine-5)-methyltransferase 1